MHIARAKQTIRECMYAHARSAHLEHYVPSALKHLENDVCFQKADNVLMYVPYADEIPFTQALQDRYPQKMYFIPHSKTDIAFTAIGSDLKWNPHGGATCVLVPGVAFTKEGVRLGRGGGWYDRFLQKHQKSLCTRALVPGYAVLETLPQEQHDVPVNRVLVCTK